MTIHARVALARQRLTGAGIPDTEAALSARLLAQHVLGWDAARFVANATDPEPAAFAEQYDPLIRRRELREPVAYLTGHREFWGLDFAVSRAVLIPRPETELIVETVCALLPDRSRQVRLADVGTGSGCLAVALAHEYPRAHVVATDISGDALDVARANADRHHVRDRISFTRADLLDGIGGSFDAIVSNPPYVPDSDRPFLQSEVRDHEPATALFGGQQGLHIIRRLLEAAPVRLAPAGLLLFEFGLGQAERIRALIAAAPPLEFVEIKADLQGVARVAICRRPRREPEDTQIRRRASA